jgi:hypothetical protein
VATDDVPLSWSGEVSVADLTLPAFTVAEYRLAYTVLDRRPYYVEEGVLERWTDLPQALPRL